MRALAAGGLSFRHSIGKLVSGMKQVRLTILGAIALGFLAFSSSPVRAEEEIYRLVKEIPVGGEGGWDALTADSDSHRLYVSHATKVVVIDTEKNSVIAEYGDMPGVHGFAVAPELNRGFSSNGRENKVSVVDLKTSKTIMKVDTGANPDAIIYEPGQKEVYAFNGRDNSATVIDAATGKVATTITLSGKPEFAEVDVKAGRVYVNIEDKNEVAVIDTKTHKVVESWPIAPGEEASGIAIDLANHRLFLGCGNKMMVMMDSTNGKVLGNVPIGQGVDGAAFDPENKLAFASCGDSSCFIAKEEAPGKLTTVQTLKTERGARTIAIDQKTHNIYLPTAKFEAQAEQTSGTQRQRPRPITGTFKILVYGMR